jgi:hypothetical protein
MAEDKRLTFLIKEIPRPLWAKVKALVFREKITIRVFLLDAIKEALKDESRK